MEIKSAKDLAFLYDLYIGTDWAERFAALVDEHVELPKEGRALYVAAGTGGHALALKERDEQLTLLCVDENAECLEIAQAKAVALHQEAEFQREDPQQLSFKDDQFDLVLGDASLTPPIKLKSMLAEMVRVAKPGARLAVWFPTAPSFGEVFSIYWEAFIGWRRWGGEANNNRRPSAPASADRSGSAGAETRSPSAATPSAAARA